jgi:hypothetical protein
MKTRDTGVSGRDGMADEQQPRASELSGALIGWERRGSRHGMIMTLQIVENAAQFQDHQYHRVSLAMNDRQLRSLARDLARAARSRGLDLRAKAPLHRRLWTGLKSMVMG